jgi:hypothetical protein
VPCPVGLQGRLKVRGQRLVQDQQVDLVDSELAGALVEAVQGLVVAVVADPDLGSPRRPQSDPGQNCAALLRPAARCRRQRQCRCVDSWRRAPRRPRLSSGGVWNTPRPSAGISMLLFSVIVETSGMIYLFRSWLRGRSGGCGGTDLAPRYEQPITHRPQRTSSATSTWPTSWTPTRRPGTGR